VTKLRAENPKNRGSITGRGRRVLTLGYPNRRSKRLIVGQAIA